jgi:hypothetical protein
MQQKGRRADYSNVESMNQSSPTKEQIQTLISILPENLKITIEEGMKAVAGEKNLKPKTRRAISWVMASAFRTFIDPSGHVKKCLAELEKKGANVTKIAFAILQVIFK